MRHATAPALALGAVLFTACGPGRTSAATQPTPVAFDAAQSDAAAIELADAGVAALGGQAAWDAVKQLSFTIRYTLDGEPRSLSTHHWDRWNGRHNFQSADLATDTGEADSMQWMEVFYDMFDSDAMPTASYGGQGVTRKDADRFRTDARKRLAEDAYMLTMVFKVRDPGVMLHEVGEIKDVDGVCTAGCKTVKVTFDPAVGKDTWFINYDLETKLPVILEKQTASGRIGFQILEWADAGGLKFPSKFQNMGLKGEVFEYSALAVAEPDDRYYIPQVTGD